MITLIRLTILFFISVCASSVLASSTIIVTNGDVANFGFNDRTPITPAGGNNARTLGQARLNAVQYTANKLSIKLNSNVEINIIASFTSFGGDARGAVLAGAFAPSYALNFSGAPVANTLYHVAVAEKISGIDTNSNRTGVDRYEVSIEINSDVDGAALGARKWYYGFDALPLNGDVDFVTVLTHEIIHGLGFSTQMNSSSGRRNRLLNDNYINNLENHGAAPANYNAMGSDGQRAAGNVAAIYDRFNAITGTNLHWIGPALTAAANNNVGFQTTTGHAGMFSPSPVQRGSSVSHFSKLFNAPNEMMEPAYRGANHNIGFAAQILEDVGWGRLNSNSASTELAISVTNPNANPVVGSNEVYSISVVNNSAQTATGIVISNFLPANSSFVTFTTANTGICSTSNVKFNRILTCNLPSLPASGTAIFNVTVAINNAGTSEYGANVESLNRDSNWLNNNALNTTAPTKPPVNPPPAQLAPRFNMVGNKSVVAGQTVSFNVIATDDDGDVPELVIQNQPRGSQFVADGKGGAMFSWITTPEDIGVRGVNFIAKDGNPNSQLSDNLIVQIRVNAIATVDPQLPTTPTNPVGDGGSPQRSNNDVPTGGCTLNQTAKFDPVLPLLILLSTLFFIRKRKVLQKL